MKMVSLAGATSKKIWHYLNGHQTNSSADTVMLHVGVMICWKIKNRKRTEKSYDLVQKCHTYGIKNIFLSGLV